MYQQTIILKFIIIWAAAGLSAISGSQRLAYSRQRAGFLRQPPPANYKLSRRFAGMPLQSLPLPRTGTRSAFTTLIKSDVIASRAVKIKMRF